MGDFRLQIRHPPPVIEPDGHEHRQQNQGHEDAGYHAAVALGALAFVHVAQQGLGGAVLAGEAAAAYAALGRVAHEVVVRTLAGGHAVVPVVALGADWNVSGLF